MNALLRTIEALESIRETRFSALRSPAEFFNVHRLSKPADAAQVVSRITYNTRYFVANYTIIVIILAVYAIITNPLFLISLTFLFGGFAVVNRFGAAIENTMPVTQKTQYIALFVIGLPLLFISSPFSTFFFLVGASSFIILAHAVLMEPGVESGYESVQEAV